MGCYSLRHEHVTQLVQNNVDMETTKQLEGWTQIMPTYFHSTNKRKQQALQNIDKQYETNITS